MNNFLLNIFNEIILNEKFPVYDMSIIHNLHYIGAIVYVGINFFIIEWLHILALNPNTGLYSYTCSHL